MPARIVETTITFKHPFRLASMDGPQPAGTYRLSVEQEEILGLSFLAFRRRASVLHLPAITVVSTSRQEVPIDAAELASALEADKRA